MIVTLPWPDSILSPNARSHWFQVAKAKRKAHADAFFLARDARDGLETPNRAIVFLEFVPPDRRRRDLDNLIASMKAALDGLADALGCDDSKFILGARLRNDTTPHGAVIVTVTVTP